MIIIASLLLLLIGHAAIFSIIKSICTFDVDVICVWIWHGTATRLSRRLLPSIMKYLRSVLLFAGNLLQRDAKKMSNAVQAFGNLIGFLRFITS